MNPLGVILPLLRMSIYTKPKMTIGHILSMGAKQRPCWFWCSGFGFICFPGCCRLLALAGKLAKRQVKSTCLSWSMLFSSLMTLRSNKSAFAQVGNNFSQIMPSLVKSLLLALGENNLKAIWVLVSNNMTMLHCETQKIYLGSEWTYFGASVWVHYCWGSKRICECM